MEELSESFATSFQVTFEANTTAAPHPRFSQYKSRREILDQNERRRRILLLQKEKRFDYVTNVRRIINNDWTEEEEEEEEKENEDNKKEEEKEEEQMEYSNTIFKKPGRFYKNQLMLSEWLVEVPSDLEEEWLLVVCPIGKRCLIVASGGSTSVYTKSGYMLYKFSSLFPGGNRKQFHQEATILDCIYDDVEKVYYILDLMSWNGYPLYDSETEFRFYWLHSKFQESSENFEKHPNSQYRFIPLPNFTCNKEIIANALASANFNVDGILFYHKRTHYTFGSTPLVVWLKPYMLPELLSVPVPESMLALMPEAYSNYSEHLALVEKDRLNFKSQKDETENLMEFGPPAKQKRNRGKKKKKKKKSSEGQSPEMEVTIETVQQESESMEQQAGS